jgi:hypothetical protein
LEVGCLFFDLFASFDVDLVAVKIYGRSIDECVTGKLSCESEAFFLERMYLSILSFKTINKLKLFFECAIPMPQDAGLQNVQNI